MLKPLVGCCLAVGLSLVAGCGGGATTVTVTSATTSIDAGPANDEGTTTAATTTQTGSKIAKIGWVEVDGSLQFRVNSFRATTAALAVQQYSDPVIARKGAKFIVVNVTVKNIGKVAVTPFCGGTGSVLVDHEDRNFQPIDQLYSLAGNEDICGGELNPGFRATVDLAFEVPKDVVRDSIALWDPNEDGDYTGDASHVQVAL